MVIAKYKNVGLFSLFLFKKDFKESRMFPTLIEVQFLMHEFILTIET